jgi:hypothetical protein
MSAGTLPEGALDLIGEYPNEVTAIERQLRQVVAKAGDATYLVVSAGDVFVQFIAQPGEKTIAVEAVSDENLPDELKLSDEGLSLMHALGFEDPEPAETSDRVNFFMELPATTDAEIHRLTGTAIVAIFGAYQVDGEAKLEYELSLD